MLSDSSPKLSFARFRFTYADSRATVFPTFRPDIERLTFACLQADFEAHRDVHKLAYERLNYDWCLEPNNYDYPIEMYLQLKLLRILVTVDPSRSNYARLSNLCVRVVPLCDGSVRTAVIDQWQYIVFSSSYLQLMDEFFLYIKSLVAIGLDYAAPYIDALQKWNEEVRTFKRLALMKSDFFLTTHITAALRHQFSRAYPFIMRFFWALRQIASIEPNPFHYSDPITEPLDIEGHNAGFYLKGDRSFWTLEALIDVMDAFVLMHEVTHIIDQRPFGEERVVRNEIDADMWAISGAKNYLDDLKNRFRYIEDRVVIIVPMMIIMINTMISEVKTLYDNSIKDPNTERALENNFNEAYQRLYGVVYSARRLKLWSTITHGSTDIYFREMVLIYMSLFGRHFLLEYFEDRARANCPLFDTYLDEGDAKGAEAAWIYSGTVKQSQQIGRAENYVNGSLAQMIAFAGTGINISDSGLSNLLFTNLSSDLFSL